MNKIKDILLSAAEISKNKLFKFIHQKSINKNVEVLRVLNEVEKVGFFILPGFFSSSECEHARYEIDLIFEKYSNKIWKDELESDYRAWGINQVSDWIQNQFYNHPFLVNVREQYYKLHDEYINGFTMAGRLRFIENNLGSGGGWHRDRVNDRQLKSILYLTDVGRENGPFQYLINTQLNKSIYDTIRNNNIRYNQNRFTEAEIEDIIKTNKYPSQILNGSKGTLVIVDTSGIHRGMPIQSGERYALTNYYFVDKQKGGKGIPKNIQEILLG